MQYKHALGEALEGLPDITKFQLCHVFFQLHVTGISWSSTGSVIAASYPFKCWDNKREGELGRGLLAWCHARSVIPPQLCMVIWTGILFLYICVVFGIASRSIILITSKPLLKFFFHIFVCWLGHIEDVLKQSYKWCRTWPLCVNFYCPILTTSWNCAGGGAGGLLPVIISITISSNLIGQ